MAPRTEAEIEASLKAEKIAIQSLNDEIRQLNALRKDATEQTKELYDAEARAAQLQLDLAKATNATSKELKDLREALRKASLKASQYNAELEEAKKRQEALGGAARSLAEELAGMIPVVGGNVDYMDTLGGKLAQASVNAGSLGGGISALAGEYCPIVTGKRC